jgi:hypothetical protein
MSKDNGLGTLPSDEPKECKHEKGYSMDGKSICGQCGDVMTTIKCGGCGEEYFVGQWHTCKLKPTPSDEPKISISRKLAEDVLDILCPSMCCDLVYRPPEMGLRMAADEIERKNRIIDELRRAIGKGKNENS